MKINNLLQQEILCVNKSRAVFWVNFTKNNFSLSCAFEQIWNKTTEKKCNVVWSNMLRLAMCNELLIVFEYILKLPYTISM